MAELLNCPFCAEPVTLRYSSVRRKFIVEHKVYNRFCIIEEIAFREESLASAIAAWNRRADAVPVVRGEWRQGKEFSTYPRVPFISTAYYCSNCEGEAYWDTDYGQQLFGFCPNCGARMDGDKHE